MKNKRIMFNEGDFISALVFAMELPTMQGESRNAVVAHLSICNVFLVLALFN